ncbi:MAG TPA: A/G-specific adenine glycosylase [Puia sp.]|nr:A/G-specific adenine glycosylase [Puia sp.]
MDGKPPDFTKILLKWHKNDNIRSMPWKGEKNPYKIWLSEVILQQTRVEQGWAYYEKFLGSFPTIQDLAAAPEQKIFKCWEGLGYYSRCRNLIATAKKIVSDYEGEFPGDYASIRELRGIGPYTAAAIASFAFNLPYAVVDGNVVRVLARYFGIDIPVDTGAGKKLFNGLADSLLDRARPGIYNQAIMDFGAVVCKPRGPLCESCPLEKGCQARRQGLVASLPIKEKSIRKKKRWLHYFMLETPDEKVYIRQRKGRDIWEGLYEFVLWETDELVYSPEILQSDFIRNFLGAHKLTVKHISRLYRQELSHQTIEGYFIHLRLDKPLTLLKDYLLVDKGKLSELAFPRFINGWLLDPTPVQSLL